jgi:AraC family transcriptional regulator, positive regulator of tynA and feaB
MPEKRSLRGSASGAEETWATDLVEEAARSLYWRLALGQLYPGLTAAEALDDRPVHGRLVIRSFAGCLAAECRQGSMRMIGAAPEAGSPGRDVYNLTLQLHGVGHVTHGGRTFTRRSGEMALINAGLPFEEIGLEMPHVQVWGLPRSLLDPLLAAPGVPIGATVDGRRGIGALLVSLLQTTWREFGDLDRPMQHRIQDSLCRLAALAFSSATAAQPGPAREGGRHASLPQACAYIESRLQDPALGVEDVAEWLGLSRRRLEMLFVGTGIGVAGWISRRRVEECRKMLADPAWRHLSITDVAFTWGFGDLSTFNRRFRAHCGVAPRDLRRERPSRLDARLDGRQPGVPLYVGKDRAFGRAPGGRPGLEAHPSDLGH